jgi:hypothetical protein
MVLERIGVPDDWLPTGSRGDINDVDAGTCQLVEIRRDNGGRIRRL